MLIIRNTPSGLIWQAYTVYDTESESILRSNAEKNGFCTSNQPVGYTKETSPGWQDSAEWKQCLEIRKDPTKHPQYPLYQLMATVKRDGPYWLGGYKDWLVACFSLRSLDDLKGYTPIACYSEQDGCCKQWLIMTKEGQFYIDANFGSDHGRGCGVKPALITEVLLPSRIYDWAKQYAPTL